MSSGKTSPAPVTLATRISQGFEPYEEGEDWTIYSERLEQWLIANDVKDDDKKRALLLTFIGGKVYGKLRDLLTPETPDMKTYEELCDTLKEHFQPARLEIAERFRFHRHVQGSESVSEFMLTLKKLSEHCKFGAFRDEALRDRFVCGL